MFFAGECHSLAMLQTYVLPPEYRSLLISILHLCFSSPSSQFYNSKDTRISSLDSIDHMGYKLFWGYISFGRKYIIIWFIHFQCLSSLVNVEVYL